MVSLTLHITVSRRASLDHNPPPPSYDPSIYSTHEKRYSYSLNNFSVQDNKRTSVEELLQNDKVVLGRRERLYNKHLELTRGERNAQKMTGSVDMGERKKSFGIGGAGNIRRPSDVIYPVRMNSDGTRRRSSVWSSMNVSPGTSPDGRRGSILSLFRRGSVQTDAGKMETESEEK